MVRYAACQRQRAKDGPELIAALSSVLALAGRALRAGFETEREKETLQRKRICLGSRFASRLASAGKDRSGCLQRAIPSAVASAPGMIARPIGESTLTVTLQFL